MKTSILLCGVGGQGILLAAKVIGAAAAAAGFPVVANETHGMAQRGGCVKAQVKFGEKATGPLIAEGEADVLASMECIEALRWAHFLKPGGLAAVSLHRGVPVTVSSGAAIYPSDAEDRLARTFPNLVALNCDAEATAMGNARLANSILVGMLSRALPSIPDEAWREAFRTSVKPAFLQANLNAFDRGARFQSQKLQPSAPSDA